MTAYVSLHVFILSYTSVSCDSVKIVLLSDSVKCGCTAGGNTET